MNDLIDARIPKDMPITEIEERIARIKSSLLILDHMKKMYPEGSPAWKCHQLFTLRSVANDALGVKGEEMDL